MPSYVIYARKSSESEDRQVLSIDSQIRELKAIAQRERVQIAEVLTETRSAKAPGRPVFGELMRRINRGEVAGVLCWKMDRLSRNPLDSGVLLQAQADGKLERIITIAGVKTADSNDRLMGTFELAFATKFIDDLRANTKRGLRERLSRGWATYLPPIGYMNDVVNKTIVRDPDRFQLVRKMWDELLAGGKRPEQIRAMANEDWGLRTRKLKRQGGKPLGRTTVYSMFGNPFYMGVIQLKDGRRFAGKHEPMVTREEFDRAQRLLGRPGRQRPVAKEFAFTGLIKCGNCGATVTAEEHFKPSGRRYVYYHCSRQRRLVEKCREPAISEPELVGQLSSTFGRLAIPDPVLAWLKQKAERILTTDRERQQTVRQTLTEAIQSVEREQSNLLSLQLRDLVPVEVYAKKSRELEDRRQALQDRLANVDRNNEDLARRLADLLDFAAGMRELFAKGTGVQQRIILEAAGSNYVLQSRKVSFHLEKPLTLVAEASGCSNWLRLVDDLRTWALNTNEYFKVPNFVYEGRMPESASAV
jgi:DNA invertase Pin-like site-specific DNA recombinase